jgi:hypothetical protein
MVFRTDRRLLVPPAALGALNVALGGGMLGMRAASGRLVADLNAAGAATLLVLGAFFLIVAWRLFHYRLEVSEKGLAVGVRPRGPSSLLPWGEIERLDRYTAPAKGGRTPAMIYRVTAGKREVGFSSQLFPGHADLASLIGEHTGKAWEPFEIRR